MDNARAERMKQELLGQIIDDWTIIEYIGAGKSALVFRATRNSDVGAIKIFDPELVERCGKDVQIARIQRELSLKNHNNQNLVKVFDGGECHQTHYLYVVMEVIASSNLMDMLNDVPRDQIWPILSQVAQAAKFLEERKLAHRDIKPANIAVTPSFDRAILLDLGILRPIGVTGLTDDEQHSFIGTLQYSSPEFLFRTEEDTLEGWRALTFYQLGAVLHDLIMRERLFQKSSNPYARLVEAVKYDIPIITGPDVSPDLLLLARNCLQKDPVLRLRLVKWDDFEPHAHRPANGSDARERIRKRHIQSQQNRPDADREADQFERAMRRTVEDIRSRLQALVRAECIGSDLFPPVEIHDHADDARGRTHFVVSFASSPARTLAKPVSIWFTLVILDEASAAVEVMMGASLSRQLDLDATHGAPLLSLFQGVFDEAVLKPLLNDALCIFYDKAQQISVEVPELTWLEVSINHGDERIAR